jgi:hypothetical protein
MAITTIVQGMLASDAVTTSNISAYNVQSLNIASSAIETRHLVLSAVDRYNISSNAIEPRHVSNNTIETRHISTSAITLTKLNESVENYFTNVQIVTSNSTSIVIAAGFETVYNGKILHIRDNVGTCQINFTTPFVAKGFNMTIVNESIYNVQLTSTSPGQPLSYGKILSGSQAGNKLYTSATVYRVGDDLFAIGALSQ